MEKLAIQGQVPDASSQVFYHDTASDPDVIETAVLLNERLPIGLYIQYRKNQFKNLLQWKMLGQGDYVLGIEPANCHVEGRATERARGTLEFMAPGEKRQFHLELGVLDSEAEFREWRAKIEQLV